MFDWEDSPNINPNNVGAYLDHLVSILPSPDTAAIAELWQLATIPLGDLDNDTSQQMATAKTDAFVLDRFFGEYGGGNASGIMPF